MLNQPSNITPDEINGSGTVDLSGAVDFSWQVSGDSAMTAYQIDFFSNNAASTQMASTGRVTLPSPFWGVDYKGETQFFTATVPATTFSSAGMTNGNEYKFVITMWWGAGVNNYVVQATASLIEGRAAPVLSINAIPSPLTTRSYSITGSYSQAQGDALAYVRWQIATVDNRDDPFLDTGKIRGTGQLQVDYDGFFTDTTYSVMLTVQTQMDVTVSTGWVDFTVSYPVSEPQGQVQACQLLDDAGVYVHWDQMDVAEGYAVYRRESTESVLMKIADVDATTGQLRDYSAKSGHSYVYYIFPIGTLAYLTEPMISEPVPVQYWIWAILEAQEGADGIYHLLRSYLFRMGEGGVKEGQFSNNNVPQLLKNFTRYPTRQPETSNYLTGNVSGYIGTVDWTKGGYADTVAQSDAIFQLSTSQNAIFLLDPKGHFLRVHTSEAIAMTVKTKTMALPQTMTVGWAEVGSTEQISVIAAPGGEYYPKDTVIGTSITIIPQTGALVWTTSDEYKYGSILSLNQASGALLQTASGSFTAADMEMDQSTGIVTAEV